MMLEMWGMLAVVQMLSSVKLERDVDWEIKGLKEGVMAAAE